MVLTPVIAKAEVTPSSMDISAVFASNEINATVLSQQEMKETEGAWVNYDIGAGWGALGGGVSYAASNYGASGRNWRSTWSWSSFGGSVAGGAVTGAFTNPVWGATVGSAVGGYLGGYSSRTRTRR